MLQKLQPLLYTPNCTSTAGKTGEFVCQQRMHYKSYFVSTHLFVFAPWPWWWFKSRPDWASITRGGQQIRCPGNAATPHVLPHLNMQSLLLMWLPHAQRNGGSPSGCVGGGSFNTPQLFTGGVDSVTGQLQCLLRGSVITISSWVPCGLTAASMSAHRVMLGCHRVLRFLCTQMQPG